jgi:hypothetical protein
MRHPQRILVGQGFCRKDDAEPPEDYEGEGLSMISTRELQDE